MTEDEREAMMKLISATVESALNKKDEEKGFPPVSNPYPNPKGTLESLIKDLFDELDKRVADKIIEESNANLLKKLISKAETTDEAFAIASMGTMYKKTGFHFTTQLEKTGGSVYYFKRDEGLSFKCDADVGNGAGGDSKVDCFVTSFPRNDGGAGTAGGTGDVTDNGADGTLQGADAARGTGNVIDGGATDPSLRGGLPPKQSSTLTDTNIATDNNHATPSLRGGLPPKQSSTLTDKVAGKDSKVDCFAPIGVRNDESAGTAASNGAGGDSKVDCFVTSFPRNDERGDALKSGADGVNKSAGALTHTLIIGDNYPALQNLLIEYAGRIDVIYIDPPYGRDAMGDFAKTNYDNAITRDNLLSMLYPRLRLAKKLLSDTGVIFCSIDDRNQAYVKGLFDEVMGEENFVASLVWQKKKGGSQDSQDFAKEHEYILCYKKSNWVINDIKEEQDEDVFNKVINNRAAKIMKLEKWGIGALKQDAPTLYYSIKDPNGNDFYPIAPNGQDGRWRKKPENLDSEHIIWQKNNKGRLIPYEVIYFDEVDDVQKVIKMRTILTEYGTTTDATKEILSIFNNTKVFDFAKPVELIKQLIRVATTKDDALVLDFFAGSGTTGQAVLELNKADGGTRRFILVTNNEKTATTPGGIARDVTSKRLKRVMTGSCYDGATNFKWLEKHEPLGGGLDVLEVAEVNDNEHHAGSNLCDVVDETLYGRSKFSKLEDKIEWLYENFNNARRYLEERR